MKKYIFFISFLVFILASIAEGHTTISVHKEAYLTVDKAVTLGDVTEIKGKEAQTLSSLTLFDEQSAGTYEVDSNVKMDIQEIRQRLNEHNVNWGRIILRGSSCTIHFVAPQSQSAVTPTTQSATSLKKPHSTTTATQTPAHETGETVRTHVIRRLAEHYNVSRRDLRLTFQSPDEDLLSVPTTGRSVDAQPTANRTSSRTTLRVYVYENEHIVAKGSISVDVEIRQKVLTAVRMIDRGSRFSPNDYQVSTQWIKPSILFPIDEESIRKHVARRRIQPGRIITAEDVESPEIIERGDTIYVHCRSGSFTIKAKAFALEDARKGDTFEAKLASNTEKVVRARAAMNGIAVLDITEYPNTTSSNAHANQQRHTRR